MMFEKLARVRVTLDGVLKRLPMDSPEAPALIDTIEELADAMVADVRAGTYANASDNAAANFCGEPR